MDKSNPLCIGYVYLLTILGDKKLGEKSKIKIGVSQNIIMRLSHHQHKTFKDKIVNRDRVSLCFDYLICEAKIKKLTNGKELVDYDSDLYIEIINIIDKHLYYEMDSMTMDMLMGSPSLKTYYQQKNLSTNLILRG